MRVAQFFFEIAIPSLGCKANIGVDTGLHWTLCSIALSALCAASMSGCQRCCCASAETGPTQAGHGTSGAWPSQVKLLVLSAEHYPCEVVLRRLRVLVNPDHGPYSLSVIAYAESMSRSRSPLIRDGHSTSHWPHLRKHL
jgi:hypothetical protein